MKLGRRFKALLLVTSAVLYATGLAAWALGWERFKTDHGLGPEPSPLRPAALHAHAVAGADFEADLRRTDAGLLADDARERTQAVMAGDLQRRAQRPVQRRVGHRRLGRAQ